MPEFVRVKRQNGFGQFKKLDWEIKHPILRAVQSERPTWNDLEFIASMVADAIPTKNLKRQLIAMEAVPKKYKQPIVVKESFKISLPDKQQLHYHVELRFRDSDGVVEVHPRAEQQAIDQKRVGHA